MRSQHLVRAAFIAGCAALSSSLYAVSGTLDPTFGIGGKVTTDSVAGSHDAVFAMALQPDGKIVVAGFTDNGVSGAFDFVLARYHTNGSLDSTFGSGGKVTTDFAGGQDSASGVAVQADGKIVAAGIASTALGADFGLARYNANGTLDTTFGSGGKVTTDFGSVEDRAFAVAIQPDGKIVVAGDTPMSGSRDFALARYDPDGTLDRSFGTGGKVTTDFGFGWADVSHAIAIQSDGKIVLAGNALMPLGTRTANHFAVARYNVDGSLDASFGTAGKVTTNFSGPTDPVYVIAPGDSANAVVIQPDGKIVAAGGTLILLSTKTELALARFDANGVLDPTFGSGGKVLSDFPDGEGGGLAAAIQIDGKVIVAGGGTGAATDFWLVRWNTNGTVDTTFGTGGRVTTDFSRTDDTAVAVAIQPDGKIVAAGTKGPSAGFELARYEGPTPQELTGSLSSQVQDLIDAGTINQGQGNSLSSKLNQILSSLDQGKSNAACNQLAAFINEVNSYVRSGLLSPGDGQTLIATANGIRARLGC